MPTWRSEVSPNRPFCAARSQRSYDRLRAPSRSARSDPRCSVTVCEILQSLTDSTKPVRVCRHYPADRMDRSLVLMRRWTTATLRMTCLTGGRTPRSAATGIPGRPATSLSPTCGARAVPVPRRRRHLWAHRGPVHDRPLPLSLVPPAALPARRRALPRHWCFRPTDLVRRPDAKW